MEQVFFHLHHRVVHAVQRSVPARLRLFMETSVLALSVALFAALVALHVTFVSAQGQETCLAKALDAQLPAAPHVLQIEVQAASGTAAATSGPLAASETFHIVDEPLDADGAAEGGGASPAPRFPWDESAGLAVFLFSREKGYLMLTPELRQRHGIRTHRVRVGIDDACFGAAPLPALLRYAVGFDTVVVNWIIQHAALGCCGGFLYNAFSTEVFNLNYATEFVSYTDDALRAALFKLGVLLTTLFLFFTTTTLVSFTLRETQERMLKFTYHLQHQVRNNLPLGPLVFTHVVESLVFVPIMVGILFFLFEFFSDQLLAFMVLSVVWICEVFSVLAVRTTLSTRFFPRIFFLYLSLFHIYFFSFPYGFSYLALTVCVAFLMHAVMLCFNRWELPALLAGQLTVARPRMEVPWYGRVAAPAESPAPQPASHSPRDRRGSATAGAPLLGSYPLAMLMRPPREEGKED